MGLNSDNVPTFSKGESVGAPEFRQKLNQLGDAARRSIGQPGSFQSGGVNVQRRTGGGGGSSLRTGRCTVTITAQASWALIDAGDGYVQFFNDDASHDGDEVLVKNRHNTAVAIGSSVTVDMAKSPPEVVSAVCETLADP